MELSVQRVFKSNIDFEETLRKAQNDQHASGHVTSKGLISLTVKFPIRLEVLISPGGKVQTSRLHVNVNFPFQEQQYLSQDIEALQNVLAPKAGEELKLKEVGRTVSFDDSNLNLPQDRDLLLSLLENKRIWLKEELGILRSELHALNATVRLLREGHELDRIIMDQCRILLRVTPLLTLYEGSFRKKVVTLTLSDYEPLWTRWPPEPETENKVPK